jgi:hypothetical protein
MLRGNWQKYFQRSSLVVRLSQIEDQKKLCKAKGLQGLLVVTLSMSWWLDGTLTQSVNIGNIQG